MFMSAMVRIFSLHGSIARSYHVIANRQLNRDNLTRCYIKISITDACASNPCEHAESCVQDLELGYRCQQCHSNYHGPKCEERKILV